MLTYLQLPGKLENQTHFAPSIMAQQFPMSPQANPAAFTTLIPVAPQGTILAEQMKAMTFSGTKNCVLITNPTVFNNLKQCRVPYSQKFSPNSIPALIGENILCKAFPILYTIT